MSFGSPEFFLRLKTEFYSDNNWEIHSLLDKEVRRVARFLARQAISDPQLRIDAIEDAVFRIFTYSIHKFLEDPAFETADERDRINWLYRAVGNAILDSLRRANVRSGVVLRGEDGETCCARGGAFTIHLRGMRGLTLFKANAACEVMQQ